MLQSFKNDGDPQAGTPTRKQCLAKLREQMRQQNISAFLVPREDAFMGEYVPECGERLKWLTGFSGSAGIAVIMADKAALLVDGRYVLQAPQQIDISCFDIVPLMQTRLHDWLNENLTEGQIIGFDPMLHTVKQIKDLKKQVSVENITYLCLAVNPIDMIWQERPALPAKPVFIHPNKFAGRNCQEKRAQIAAKIKQTEKTAFLITQPDTIAWVLNIRSEDVPRTPLALSYGLIYDDAQFDWFIEPTRIKPSIMAHMGEGVRLIAPDDMRAHLKGLTRSVLLDPATANYGFIDMIENYVESEDLCALPKACKTEAEINGAQKAHIRDGVAMCEFLHWFDVHSAGGKVSEISAAQKLEQCRKSTGKLKDLSFDTISGGGPHGAIVHYRVTEKTNRVLRPGELYLVDSGGQYEDGTTDVTRTILVDGAPPPTDGVRAFTHVLKGHIALARARFPKGTDGVMLDAIARAPLWEAGLDFDHGTGHGVGSYLCVHEGPQRISKGGTVALQAGMIVSNEPGYYRTGVFGIRIENLQYVMPQTHKDEGERPMHKFKTLTLAPIDKRLIDISLLTKEEMKWLNNYHQRVHDTLFALLSDDAAKWLTQVTAAI